MLPGSGGQLNHRIILVTAELIETVLGCGGCIFKVGFEYFGGPFGLGFEQLGLDWALGVLRNLDQSPFLAFFPSFPKIPLVV